MFSYVREGGHCELPRREFYSPVIFVLLPLIDMVVGLLTAELEIDSADSLKDKRQVLKSLLAHLRNAFNVSASEVGSHDIWRRAEIGVAVVATDAQFADQVLSKVADHIDRDPRVVLGHYETEIL